MILSLLRTFLPWILFSALPHASTTELKKSLIILFLVTLVANFKELKGKFLLPWCALITFIALFVSVTIFNLAWLPIYLFVITNMILACVAWGSLAIGEPFTLQYARLEIAKDKWQTPSFIFINQAITAAWGASFFINALLNLAHKLHPHILGAITLSILTTTSTVGGVVFTKWFPRWYHKRVKDE